MTENEVRGEEAKADASDVTIPMNNWKSFLDSFSRQHDQWLASVVVTMDGRQLVEVNECRLDGVSPDRKIANERLHVMLICGNGDHLDHVVEKPSNIVFKLDGNGAHVGLDITSADGSQTTVRFRTPARPETLDGVVTA